MNDVFITEVLQKMMGDMDQEQCTKLNEVLRITLQKYEELKERSTEIWILKKPICNIYSFFLYGKNRRKI